MSRWAWHGWDFRSAVVENVSRNVRAHACFFSVSSQDTSSCELFGSNGKLASPAKATSGLVFNGNIARENEDGLTGAQHAPLHANVTDLWLDSYSRMSVSPDGFEVGCVKILT